MILHERDNLSGSGGTHLRSVLNYFVSFVEPDNENVASRSVKMNPHSGDFEVLSFEKVKTSPQSASVFNDDMIKANQDLKSESIKPILREPEITNSLLSKREISALIYKVEHKNSFLTKERSDQISASDDFRKGDISEVKYQNNGEKVGSRENVRSGSGILNAKGFKVSGDFSHHNETRSNSGANSDILSQFWNVKSVNFHSSEEGYPALNRVEVSDVKVQDVVDVVKKFVKADGEFHNSEIILKLEPKELGEVVVKISQGEKGVKILFEVKNEDVKQMIESNIYNLKASLEESGVNFERIGIKIDGFGFNSDGSRHEQNFKRFNRKKSPDYVEPVRIYGESLIEAII